MLHNNAAKAREREREREVRCWGSRFYLHLQPLLHKYPGRHCWHLGPVVPSLHIQNPVPLQRSLTEPKGLQLHSGRTRHTNTHTGWKQAGSGILTVWTTILQIHDLNLVFNLEQYRNKMQPFQASWREKEKLWSWLSMKTELISAVVLLCNIWWSISNKSG